MISLLDHGYVKFIEPWGKGSEPLESQEFEDGVDWERGIIEAARQSTQGSFRGWDPATCSCSHARPLSGQPYKTGQDGNMHHLNCNHVTQPGDARLLKFLYSNHHDTPFEFAGMVIEVQAPIFVFREWHRHRTQSYNEMSARYEPLPDSYYIPDYENVVERLIKGQSTANKQASGSSSTYTPQSAASLWLKKLDQFYRAAENLYQDALIFGIPKELARLSMPVGHYSRMRASANLRNWLAFLTLRQDPKAQWEIRQYANAVAQLISQTFPRTYELFVDRRSGAA